MPCPKGFKTFLNVCISDYHHYWNVCMAIYIVPSSMGIKKLPFVEQTRIREISASDYSNIKYKHPKHDGVIEFITDKNLMTVKLFWKVAVKGI